MAIDWNSPEVEPKSPTIEQDLVIYHDGGIISAIYHQGIWITDYEYDVKPEAWAYSNVPSFVTPKQIIDHSISEPTDPTAVDFYLGKPIKADTTGIMTNEEMLVSHGKLKRLLQLLSCCNQVWFSNTTRTVRIEYGKVGKEGLSPMVTHDGTDDGILSALETAVLSTDYKSK